MQGISMNRFLGPLLRHVNSRPIAPVAQADAGGAALFASGSKKAQLFRWAGLLAMLLMLAACATGGPVTPAPVVPEPPDDHAPLVARFEDGREGFTITEAHRMTAESRRDFRSAVALLNDRDYDHAIELLETIVQRSPGATAPYINLGIAYRRIDKPEQAEEQFKTALGMVPGHPVACNEYGLLCRKAGRFDEARTIYEQALMSFPEYYPVHRNAGILCDLYLNDLESALAHYEAYSRAVPDDGQVKMWIADLHARLGRQ